MSRIDGLSISTITLPSGTIVHKLRVRRPDGTYAAGGNFRTKLEAKRAGLEMLRGSDQAMENHAIIPTAQPDVVQKNGVINPVWFAPVCREVAELQRQLGYEPGRPKVFDNLAKIIEREGFGDMNSGTFGKDVFKWLGGLKANWCNDDPNWKGRRTTNFELSNTTRNMLLVKIGIVVNYEMAKVDTNLLRYPLLRKPLKKALVTFPVKDVMKSTFQVNELRALVTSEMDHDAWWLPACLLTYTGCRAQEAMFMRWEWCDWEARIIKLQYSDDASAKIKIKTGERNIPMMKELYDILQKVGPKPHGYIIEDEHMRTNGSCLKKRKRTKEVKHAYTDGLRLYCERCGVNADKLTAHSLRHNYIAIRLAMRDNFNDVMEAVGHMDESTTLGYARMKSSFTVAVKDWPEDQFQLRTDATPMPFVKAR